MKSLVQGDAGRLLCSLCTVDLLQNLSCSLLKWMTHFSNKLFAQTIPLNGLFQFKLFKIFVETRMKKAEKRAEKMKKWSWIGIVAFVWMPFPMTGAIMGFLIARAEGYKTIPSLTIAIPSMWVGVVCWTIWFDELYKVIERIGHGLTTYITLLLVAFPFISSLTGMAIKKTRSLIKKRKTQATK